MIRLFARMDPEVRPEVRSLCGSICASVQGCESQLMLVTLLRSQHGQHALAQLVPELNAVPYLPE
jgi:hypothetical protein